MSQAFICDAIRTPFGRYGGALSSVRADDLGAIPLKALMAQPEAWPRHQPVLASAAEMISVTVAMVERSASSPSSERGSAMRNSRASCSMSIRSGGTACSCSMRPAPARSVSSTCCSKESSELKTAAIPHVHRQLLSCRSAQATPDLTSVSGEGTRAGYARRVMRIAALDLGSNSFHLLVADVHPDGTFEAVTREKDMLRLGDEVAREGRITPPTADPLSDGGRLLSCSGFTGEASLDCVPALLRI